MSGRNKKAFQVAERLKNMLNDRGQVKPFLYDKHSRQHVVLHDLFVLI